MLSAGLAGSRGCSGLCGSYCVVGVSCYLNFYYIDNAELAALVILPALLPDPRFKVDISKIVFHVAKVNRKIVYIKSFYMSCCCIQDTAVAYSN